MVVSSFRIQSKATDNQRWDYCKKTLNLPAPHNVRGPTEYFRQAADEDVGVGKDLNVDKIPDCLVDDD